MKHSQPTFQNWINKMIQVRYGLSKKQIWIDNNMIIVEFEKLCDEKYLQPVITRSRENIWNLIHQWQPFMPSYLVEDIERNGAVDSIYKIQILGIQSLQQHLV